VGGDENLVIEITRRVTFELAQLLRATYFPEWRDPNP
jgi:hypothetical protein